MSTLELKELSAPAGEVIKIASGKTLDLHSQGTTKMPAGSVIQVVQTYSANSSAVASSASSFVATGIIATITPKYSGSKILVSWSNTMNNSGEARANMYIRIGSGSYAAMAGASSYHLAYAQGSSNGYGPQVFNGNYTTTSLNALYFQPYIYADSGTYNFIHANSSYALTLTEVAQ